jgi:hypothetical protein
MDTTGDVSRIPGAKDRQEVLISVWRRVCSSGLGSNRPKPLRM